MRSLLLTLLVVNPFTADAATGHGRRGKDCDGPPKDADRGDHDHARKHNNHRHTHIETITHYYTETAEPVQETSSALAASGSSSTFVVVPSSSASPPDAAYPTQDQPTGGYPTQPTGGYPTQQEPTQYPTKAPETTTLPSSEPEKETETETEQPETTYSPTAQPSETHTAEPAHTEQPTTQQPTEEPTTQETATPTPTYSGGGGGGGGAYAEATEVPFKIGPTQQCGNEDTLVLPGLPWGVSNSMYHASDMVGQQCTNFESVLEAGDQTSLVRWSSQTRIQKVEETKDLCKGYSNIGIGKNLKRRWSEVESIPAYFKWDRKVNGEAGSFRGANVFDFILAPERGDSESTQSSEFMLFLETWGNQLPIAWDKGPVARTTMYGMSWRLYEGQNEFSGVTVRSMMPDGDFNGEFQGDLKEWIDFMVRQGYVTDSQYFNTGNAGSEVFWGSADMEATVALDVNLVGGQEEFN